MDIWHDKLFLEEASKRRDKFRKAGKQLAFDCMHLKCTGARGVCDVGEKLSLSKDGSIDIRLILNGITPTVCKECKAFNPDTDD